MLADLKKTRRHRHNKQPAAASQDTAMRLSQHELLHLQVVAAFFVTFLIFIPDTAFLI
jgi:hypothetical protein